MTRFNRTIRTDASQNTTAPSTSTPSDASATSRTAAKEGQTMEYNLQELTQRLETLKARRTRREIELENAEREIQECQVQAAKLGANSYEELVELVRKQQEEDAQAIAAFAEALDKEEELLDTIDRRLSEAQGS